MSNFFVFLLALNIFCCEDQRFVNQKSGFVVLEQKRGKVIFHDLILEAEMVETGVVIPPAAQGRYNYQERIKLSEEGFFEAFKEFYSIYIYDQDLYRWQD